MKNLFLSCALLLAAPIALHAQGAQEPPKEAPAEKPKHESYLVVVTVVDEHKEPLSDVTITLDDREAIIVTRGETDGTGQARLVSLQSGDYFVRTYKVGYAPAQAEVKLDKENHVEVKLQLKKAKA